MTAPDPLTTSNSIPITGLQAHSVAAQSDIELSGQGMHAPLPVLALYLPGVHGLHLPLPEGIFVAIRAEVLHVSPGLAHLPDRGAVHRLAFGRTQQNVVTTLSTHHRRLGRRHAPRTDWRRQASAKMRVSMHDAVWYTECAGAARAGRDE